jgi:hypothetical protein
MSHILIDFTPFLSSTSEMNAFQRVTRNLSEKLKQTNLSDSCLLHSYDDDNKENKRSNVIEGVQRKEMNKIKTKSMISTEDKKKNDVAAVISTVYYSLLQHLPKKTKQIKEYQKKLKRIISSSVATKKEQEVPLICVDLSRNLEEFVFLSDFLEFLSSSSDITNRLIVTFFSLMRLPSSSTTSVYNVLISKMNIEDLFLKEFHNFLKENQKSQALASITSQSTNILLEMIQRILYSTFRLYSCLHKLQMKEENGISPNGGFPLSPTSFNHHRRPSSPHIIWKNILIIKNFRPSTIAQQDYEILSSLYSQYSSFSYAIAEHPDDSLNNSLKNRNMLTLDDETLTNTPLINEIVYSLQLYLGGGINEKGKSSTYHYHIEGLAFLFSRKDGYEQKPHLDFNYSLVEEEEEEKRNDKNDSEGEKVKSKKNTKQSSPAALSVPLVSASSSSASTLTRNSLSSSNSFSTSTTPVNPVSSSPSFTSDSASSASPSSFSNNDDFFFPHMSYSFLYALQDNTILHFITIDDEWMTIHLMKGDLLIWNGKQLHYGGKYIDIPSNLRLFGTLRSKNVKKVDNEFYWYNNETKKIDTVGNVADRGDASDASDASDATNAADAVDTIGRRFGKNEKEI